MRDYLLLYVNDKRFEIRGERVFLSLTEFLREELRLTGTKVVCAEGDCGACTVLVGRLDGAELRYETVDACIQFLYQLDCKHVVTIEGLAQADGLHPAQEAMIRCHGSQCGFCTPGMVMALAGLCEGHDSCDEQSLRVGLTGNLCRCTGYIPILNAARTLKPRPYSAAPSENEVGHNGKAHRNEPMIAELRRTSAVGVLIQPPATAARTFFAPRQLDEALDFKARNPGAVIVSGGTELGVLRNKRSYEPAALLSLMNVPDLAAITPTKEGSAIGANVTWTQMAAFARQTIPEFHKIIMRFGSPQIRNVATLVGNVAHGSPIADALPFLCVMEAELELAGCRGMRRVKIEEFYKGYKRTDLAPDEIIVRVLLPVPGDFRKGVRNLFRPNEDGMAKKVPDTFSDAGDDELLKLYKVSRRRDLDIATFGAAIRLRRAGTLITRAFVAFSGVAPTVVRLPGAETFLQGKPFAEATFRQAGRVACGEIQPIADVRGTRDFRLLLAENIMLRFYCDCLERPQAVG